MLIIRHRCCAPITSVCKFPDLMRFVRKFNLLKKKKTLFFLCHTQFLFLHLVFLLQPKSPEEDENFVEKIPQNKMNQGMETLRQLATTSLFLQSEKNNSSNHVPSVRINTGMISCYRFSNQFKFTLMT